MFKKLFSVNTAPEFTNHFYRHSKTFSSYNIEEDREDDPANVSIIIYHMRYGKWEEIFRVFYPVPFELTEELTNDLLGKAYNLVNPWD